MKLVIQIPCYNAAVALPHSLPQLPRTVAGCDSVEWLVSDDGSGDETALTVFADLLDEFDSSFAVVTP